MMINPNKMKYTGVEKSKWKKSLEVTLKGATAGLIIGGVVGFTKVTTNSDFESTDMVILAASTSAGTAIAKKNKSEFMGYFLSIGSANIFYMIGEYSSRIIYEFLK